MPGPDRACFVDTNIWLYAFIESDKEKRAHATTVLTRADIIVSTQVVNEVCVNLVRKVQFSEPDLRRLVASFYRRYRVVALDQGVQLRASLLREQYSLSFWDSLIVASAVLSGAGTLYTEDMQHELVIEEMQILNPFVVAS
jgi:predicted nucleic acid-binding protein